MTISTSSRPEPQRIRGFEMPWNRVLRASASTSDAAAGAARALGPWLPEEFLVECVEVFPHSGDMMTFSFRRVDGAPLAFRPGQYLNISFPVNGKNAEPVDRSYSLSSSPMQPWTFDITIKRDVNGLVSSWAHDNIRPGMVLDVLGPVGTFHLPDVDRRARYLFLAAGAGITPIMSMMRTIYRLPGKADAVLLYHAAEAGGFAFSRELEHLAQMDSRLKVFYSLGDRGVPEQWAWMSGRLSKEAIEEVAPDVNGRQVYACGPEGYLNSVEKMLGELGVDDANVHMEYFSGDREVEEEYAEEVAAAGEIAEEVAAAGDEYFAQQLPELDMFRTPDPEVVEVRPSAETVAAAATIPAKSAEGADAAEGAAEASPAAESTGDSAYDTSGFKTVGEGEFQVSFMKSKLNVRMTGEDRILAVARKHGVRIQMNCQEGMCGTCKSAKLEGEVDMHHQGGIRAREIEAGKFLPCCSKPLSDVVVDA